MATFIVKKANVRIECEKYICRFNQYLNRFLKGYNFSTISLELQCVILVFKNVMNKNS